MKIIIINSLDRWSMGWATDAESQRSVIQSLEQADIEVQITEVKSLSELNAFLAELNSEEVLLWPNAYDVYRDEKQRELVWMGEVIEAAGFAFIGSGSRTLKNVYNKQDCQKILIDNQLNVPRFNAFEKNDIDDLETILSHKNLLFPLFVKPNNLSTSKGITQDCITHDSHSLSKQLTSIGEQYGYPVLVEEFLPGRDITVAVFMTPEDPVILPTYYDINLYDNPNAVLDYDVRMRDWGDGKWLTVVTEAELLEKIKQALIPICKALNINDYTRIDCRLDSDGEVKAFDVNGLPGLEMPFSTTVWQMIVRMKDYPEQHAFDSLVALVVYCACHRNKISPPTKITELAESCIDLLKS
ncbi:hypothetical protein [Sessilibacter corallicola]|uniref:ATP-grasp domain-containing protein n=1 Tax=Sessilibacter corallicola TaxID=2904075 RepID=A0ABQ0A5H8_9GAMM